MELLLTEPKDSSTIHYDEDTIPHGACSDPIHCDCMCPECWRLKADIIRAVAPLAREAADALRALERENLDLRHENEELDNTARLWHEAEADRVRRIGNCQWWQGLDSREGEKIVLTERVQALEAQLRTVTQQLAAVDDSRDRMKARAEQAEQTIAQLRAALTSLRNEASGLVNAFGWRLREAVGNSNVRALHVKIEAADAALGSGTTPGEPGPEYVTRECGCTYSRHTGNPLTRCVTHGKICPHGDPLCPCPDGDPCHYAATSDTPALQRPCGARRGQSKGETK